MQKCGINLSINSVQRDGFFACEMGGDAATH